MTGFRRTCCLKPAVGLLLGLTGLGCLTASPAVAQRIENQTAVFATLDKVTARISKLEVPLNQTVVFGSLNVTARVCNSRPPDEQPKTTSFVEVDETMLDGQKKKLFSGWMIAESPGLNAVEHPVFDVWLTDCAQPVKSAVVARAPKDGKAAAPGQPAAAVGDEPLPARPRPRR
jgi:hypothetical protein